jgi:hypothetical protein
MRALLALALLALGVSGCATTIRARVLDAETRQPIAGAVVRGVWTKLVGVPGLTSHELTGSQETETDADGRFTLDRRPSSDDGESVLVYRFGYVAWSNLSTFPSRLRRKSHDIPDDILLERFPESESHYEHLLFIGSLEFPGAERTRLLRALAREEELMKRERR